MLCFKCENLSTSLVLKTIRFISYLFGDKEHFIEFFFLTEIHVKTVFLFLKPTLMSYIFRKFDFRLSNQDKRKHTSLLDFKLVQC